MDYQTINNSSENIMRPFDKNSGKEILQYALGGLLYMPGNNTKIANQILNGEMPSLKSMVLCLEDAIGDSVVEQAEDCVKGTLCTLARAIKEGIFKISELPLIFIRVREIGQMTKICEKIGNDLSIITGFVVPKFSAVNAREYIKEFISAKELVETDLYLMPIIESRDVMNKTSRIQNLESIYNHLKIVSDSVLAIRVGGTDFCNIFGIRRPIFSTIWDIRVVADCITDIINIFGADYVVAGPTWEFFQNISNPEDTTWEEGLKRELMYDRLNGIIGKTCIHPSQLSLVQQSLIVPESDYTNALAVLSMSNQSFIGVKKGTNGNQMNESKTHLNWAKKTLSLASIYGIKNQ